MLKGESTILEKATAETQTTNVIIQLKQLQAAIAVVLLEFQLVLNSQELIIPTSQNIKAKLENVSVDENPLLKIFEQEKKNSSNELALQKTKLLPELILGYNNNSFKGIGLDDSKRFHSAQLGLGIPLFGGSQKAKINAYKIAKSSAENKYSFQVLNLKTEYSKVLTHYKATLEIVNYFEISSIKNSKTITETATKQFINGEINYLDFVVVTNQSISTQNAYLEAINTLNDAIIALNYLNLKN